jgi:hypothetical protein
VALTRSARGILHTISSYICVEVIPPRPCVDLTYYEFTWANSNLNGVWITKELSRRRIITCYSKKKFFCCENITPSNLQTDNVAVSGGGSGGASVKQITLTVESIRFSPQLELAESPLPVFFCFIS